MGLTSKPGVTFLHRALLKCITCCTQDLTQNVGQHITELWFKVSNKWNNNIYITFKILHKMDWSFQ